MTSKVVLVTPPDKLFNQNHSILLIYPSNTIKSQVQDILSKTQIDQTVYIYDVKEDDEDIDWLLSVAKMSDVVIIDLDNCSHIVKGLSSYIVSLSNTYWLTSDDKFCYNKLSNNRIYGLDVIENLLGVEFEEQS